MRDHNVLTTSWILKTREDRFSDEVSLCRHRGIQAATSRNSRLISFSCNTEDSKLFNLFNARIKRRLGSLKGVRNLVQKLVDFERVNEWIVVCIILYYIFVTIDDTALEEGDEEITNVELGEVAATDDDINLR